MIKLDVEAYCQNCPDFTPESDSIGYYGAGCLKMCDTTVRCKYKGRCAGIAEYLKDHPGAEAEVR